MWSVLGPERLMSRAEMMGAQTFISSAQNVPGAQTIGTVKMVTFVVLLIYSSIRYVPVLFMFTCKKHFA